MNRTPPQDVIDKVAAINKELKPYGWKEGQPRPELVAYYLEDGAHDNDWRCHLVDAQGNLLASYLVPDQLQWHVVRMFLNGFEERRKADFKAGQQDAVNKLHEANQRMLGLIR
jgi:hypothetical protein